MTAPTLQLADAARMMRAFRKANRGALIWLYAFQAGNNGPIKIGVSRDPKQRLATLQAMHYETLRPLASERVVPIEEKWLHQAYVHARIRGEWFRPTPDLLTYLAALGDAWEDWA